MEYNPLDIVQQRMTDSYTEYKAAVWEFEKESIERSIAFFKDTSSKFLRHLRENDYPFANIREIYGDRYLSYPLYDELSVEGELLYRGQPVSLLIDERQHICYIHETCPPFIGSSSSYRKKYQPVPITIPDTAEQYRAQKYPDVGKNPSDGQEMLRWASYMIQQMERFQRFGHSTEMYAFNGTPDVDDIYKAVRDHVFPDGSTREMRQKYQAGR